MPVPDLRRLLILLMLPLALCACTDRQTAYESTGANAKKTPSTEIGKISTSHAPRQQRDNSSPTTKDKVEAKPPKSVSEIVGSVRDSAGAPLSEATVTLWVKSDDRQTTLPWQRFGIVESRADGTYSVAAPPKGELCLTARKDGWAVASAANVARKADADAAAKARLLLQLQPEVSLSGRVIGPDGKPISGAQVLACPATLAPAAIGEFQTTTSATGDFRLTNLPSGKLPIAILPPGGTFEFFDALAPVDSFELKLKVKPARVDGKLVSDDTDLSQTTATMFLEMSSPVPGLNIGRRIPVDHGAAFDFGAVPSISSFLTVESDPPGTFMQVPADPYGRKPRTYLELTDGKTTHVVIQVSSGKQLHGMTVDVATSAPLPGVRIYPFIDAGKPKPAFAESDARGNFVLPHVTFPGIIEVESDEYYPVLPEQEQLERHDLSTTLTIALAAKPWVRGRVESQFKNAVPGATLELYNLQSSNEPARKIPLDSSGEFQAMVTPGKYRLFTQAPSLPPAFLDLTITPHGVSDIVLKLSPGRRVSGIVLSPTGQPVAGAEVLSQLCKPGDILGFDPYYPNGDTNFRLPFGRQITDASGAFSFEKIPADAGMAVIARSTHFASTAPKYTDAAQGDVTDLQLKFPPSATLRGTVQDDSGKPVAGAKVQVSDINTPLFVTKSASTTTTGAFEIKNLEIASEPTLLVEAENYVSHRSSIQVSDKPVSITLTRLFDTSLLVRCMDLKGQKPLEAQVTARSMSNFADKGVVGPVEDRPGVSRVSGLKIGQEYSIRAESPRYIESWKIVKITPDKSQEVELFLRPGGRVKGRVVDEAGDPVKDASIKMRSAQTATSDAAGNFEFELTQENAFYNAVAPDGRKSDSFSPRLIADGIDEVGDIVVRGDKEQLVIRVLRGPDHKPAAGIKVEVGERPLVTGVTDAAGEFVISIERDKYVSINLPEWKMSRNLDTKRYSGSLRPTEVIFHIGSARLTGHLLQAGQPTPGKVTGTNNSFPDMTISADVANDGLFEFRDLTPGNWTFRGIPAGSRLFRNRGSVTFQISGDEQIEKNIQVDAGSLKGIVVDENGKPASQVPVYFSAGQASGNSISGDDGSFSLPAMDSGKITFWAVADRGRRSERVEIDPAAQTDTLIRLVLKSYDGKIICTVLSILDGLPVSYAFASLESSDGQNINASSEGSGEDVVIEGVPPGDYKLSITATGYNTAQRNISIKAGETLKFTDVLSPGSSIKVTVLDQNGYLAPGVPVVITPTDASAVAGPQTVTTDATGVANFVSVLAGTYQIHATSPAGSATSTISNRSQQVVQTTIILKP